MGKNHRKPLTLQQKTQRVDGVFEIRLTRRFGTVLKFIEIFLNILRIKFQGTATKMQRYGCQMTTITLNGFWTSAQNGQIATETVIESFEALNFFNSTFYKIIDL